MTNVHKYSAYFEKKEEEPEKPYNPEEFEWDYGDNPYPGYTGIKPAAKKADTKKKVKKGKQHPLLRYIPAEILNFMSGGSGKKGAAPVPQKPAPEPEEVIEEPVYDVDELPVQMGDWVVCQDFEDLNKNQVEFLNSKPYHKVRSVCDSKGRWYQKGEPHIDVGYKIPLKMKRFKVVDRTIDAKYKILFIQFDLAIDTHGEEDKHNFFREQTKMSDLFPILFKERLPDSFVDFCQYDDIYRTGQDFYVEDIRLRDYDFVFFGFMANFTTIVKMLISYLDQFNIPYLKYGTYKDLDNKAYEMHLLQSLGYPYIPSIMASKLSKRVIEKVKEFGFPVIVKDINLNRGEGVWKVDDMKELIKTFSYGNKLMLIQKFIPNDGDYRVISIKNKVELVIKKERIKGSKEFRANVARGGKAVKGTLPSEIIQMCEEISRHLVCDIVGFDIIQNNETGEYFVMETNSSPHFPTFSVISEIDIPGILTDYIIKQVKKKK